MKMRKATTDDLESILTLVMGFKSYLNLESPSESEFRNGILNLMSGNDAEFFVVSNSRNIIYGYILLRYRFSMWASGLEARIEDLFVSPSDRQKGTGKDLVKYAIQKATEKGCATICLDTNENNPVTMKIYTQLGFNAHKERWDNGRQIFFRRSIN